VGARRIAVPCDRICSGESTSLLRLELGEAGKKGIAADETSRRES